MLLLKVVPIFATLFPRGLGVDLPASHKIVIAMNNFRRQYFGLLT